MTKKKGKGGSTLGNSLVSHDGALKSGQQTGRSERRDRARLRHTALDGGAEKSTGFTSVLEVSDLAEILYDADLSGREFAPQRGPIVVNPQSAVRKKIKKFRPAMTTKEKSVIRLPRRPKWRPEMTTGELEAAERNSFLHWRKQLAVVEESKEAMLTPFEKNLEIWRQLWRVIERSDLLVQIVDARDPLLFYCEDLDNYVDEMSTAERPKERLLLLNKADLLPEDVQLQWAEHFKRRGVQVLFFSAKDAQSQIKGDEEDTTEEHASEQEDSLNDEGAPGAATDRGDDTDRDAPPAGLSPALPSPAVKVMSVDELVAFFQGFKPQWKAQEVERKASEGLRLSPPDTRVVVGMIGYPNVGKSSTINSIMGTKKVSVSATPGRTKHLQTLLVDELLMLCDCPGLVFPNFAVSRADLVTRGVLPIDQLGDPTEAIDVVCQTVPRVKLEALYGIKLEPDPSNPEMTTAVELLEQHARARGFRTKHDQADRSRSARVILKDYVNGRTVFCSLPPDDSGGGAADRA